MNAMRDQAIFGVLIKRPL